MVTVEDTEPPRAIIGSDRTVPQMARLQFSGRASTDNWRIDTYDWTIISPSGTVTSYDTPDISHTFIEAGAHEVTLRVTDGAGLWDETHVNVTAEDVTPPVAVVREDAEIGQDEPLELDGYGSSDNEAVTNWTWTIAGPGEDVVLFGSTTEHTFGSVGYYTVTLTVLDAWGNNASASFVVTVLDTEPPLAVAGEDLVIDQGNSVHLDGTTSSDNVDIAQYLWTFIYLGLDVEKSGPLVSFTFDVPHPLCLGPARERWHRHRPRHRQGHRAPRGRRGL